MRLKLVSLFGLLSMLALAAPAAAQELAPTVGRASLSATVGFGIYVGEGDGNPYGLGLGVRGGYTLDMSVYVGGFFNYFLGESESAGGFETSVNVMPFGVEAGYDLLVGEQLVIRPSLGLGAAIFSASTSGNIPGAGDVDSSDSETYLLLAPGAQVIFPIDTLFVGGEARYYWLPTEEGGDAFLIAGSFGALL